MSRRVLSVALAAAGSVGILGLFGGSALAASTGGVSIVYDSGSTTCDPTYPGSPCFGPPNTGLKPGDSTSLLVTVQQTGTENPDATITLSWDGQLTFTGNGDTSAVCTPGSNTETCTYTDFAHGYKSDTFNFTVGANSPGQVVTTTINVATGTTPLVNDGGTDSAKATITMASPVATPTPTPTPSPSASPTGGVLGITTPDTGAGSGSPVLPVGAALLVAGGLVTVAVRRRGGSDPA